MSEKLEIALCMGSSCFARGNNVLLETLEDLIATNGWGDRIILSGLHCENRCSEGPNLKINGELFQGLDEGALLDLLQSRLGLGDGAISARTSVRKVSARRSASERNQS